MSPQEWVPPSVDRDQPSIARIWDWFLGGAHNFAIDRDVAAKTLELMPEGPDMARLNRMFLRRTVRFCVEAGVTQFLDLGSGIPTAGNTHQVAQMADPRCRVVYVDVDPVAVAHTQLILTDDHHAAVVHADLRDPDTILRAPELLNTLDLTKPVAVLMIAVLHFIHDSDDPARLIGRYRDALTEGSYLIIAHGSTDTERMPPEHLHAARRMYQREVAAVSLRSRPEVEALFAGFDLVDPGVVWLPDWRPDTHDDPSAPRAGYGGIGRKPSQNVPRNTAG